MSRSKKILISFLLVFIVFLVVSSVKASTTSCEFSDLGLKITYDEAGTSTISQKKYEKVNENWPIYGWFVTKQYGEIMYVNQLDHIEKELYGTCPKEIYACTYEKLVWGDLGLNVLIDDFTPPAEGIMGGLVGYGDSAIIFTEHKQLYLFYSENAMKQVPTLNRLPNKELVKGSEFGDNYTFAFNMGDEACGTFCGILTKYAIGGTINLLDFLGIDPEGGGGVDLYYQEYKNCDYVQYTGDLPSYNLACPNLTVFMRRFNGAINEYKKCDKKNAQCVSSTISDVTAAEDTIKDYCGTILKSYDFEGGPEQNCIEACMENTDELRKAKIDAGLEPNGDSQCGVSKRLLVWLANILRWIKYLLPVFVIIFGILDFMKGLGADKEDEMKKAQGKFIKRLIAAALVFIIPLIIEFILDKMGFGYDACGLF